jgi:hypothetical protein
MLQITIPSVEYYDSVKEEFVEAKETTIRLEHSLLSLSSWESKWNKPFLSSEKSAEEVLDYIRCMTLTQNVDPRVYTRLTKENIEAINNYIDAPMTATTFTTDNKVSKKETITAEIIYYWMIASNIPFECQKWHLNKLLTLIKVCSIKNAPPKKMSKRKTMTNNAAINAARRQALGTRG